MFGSKIFYLLDEQVICVVRIVGMSDADILSAWIKAFIKFYISARVTIAIRKEIGAHYVSSGAVAQNCGVWV